MSPDRTGNLAFRSSSLKAVDPESGLSVPRDQSPPRGTRSQGNLRQKRDWLPGVLFGLLCLFILIIFVLKGGTNSVTTDTTAHLVKVQEKVLVSYSYFEKDAIQLANAELFWKVGMGLSPGFVAPDYTDFVVVVSGKLCSPCEKLRSRLVADRVSEQSFSSDTLAAAWTGENITLLQRTENEGMDFAAHNVTIEWVQKKRKYGRYSYFIFLNSSVRGPFYPAYMPPNWQWTRAYTDRISGNVRGVSSSLVCLPSIDAGGYGPKMESWAFALDRQGLELTTEAGVFWMRKCKLCTDEQGIVVKGEYGLSEVLLGAGHNIATLMSRYRPGIDWRERKHWDCNDNVHPSRHGTYDHISMHPFETVFLKASWHVGEPHLQHYTAWLETHAQGQAGTSGAYDEAMYRYAISMKAQEQNNAADCFKVSAEQQ